MEDTYDMPYYWPDGQFENDLPQVGKDGTGVAGASDYVTAATKGNNNDVYIYLGNNGLYQLTGKTMTLTVNWSDTNNQDGLRPSDLKVQLYADKGDGSIVPVEGSAVTLPAANSENGNSLTYTFEKFEGLSGGNDRRQVLCGVPRRGRSAAHLHGDRSYCSLYGLHLCHRKRGQRCRAEWELLPL